MSRIHLAALAVALALLLAAIPACAAIATQPATKPILDHRCWQFQDNDWEHLKTTIPKAKAAGMNRIQLSHNIISGGQELWQKDRLDIVRKSVALAHENGLAVDIWTHELSAVPRGLIDQGEAAIWQFVRDKYKRVFDLVPDVDGLVLTLAETQHIIYREPITPDPPAVRTAKFIELMAEICAQRHKTLIVRTFGHRVADHDVLREALQLVAKSGGKRDNIIVMTKVVPHDWTPYYPYNPLLGDVGGLPQIVEIDLGEEFTGQSKLLHCEVDYVHRAMAHARSKGVIGAVARVERLSNHALGTPNEVNIHAFSRLTQDPALTVDGLWDEWTTARYGKAAAPQVRRALERTFDITNYTLFPLEQWISNHTEMPTWDYAIEHFSGAPVSKWLASPKYERLRDEMYAPTPETLLKIAAEKDLAKRLVEMSLADLDKARPGLAAGDYQELHRYMELSADNVETFRHHHLALFTALRYLNLRAAGQADEAEMTQRRRDVLDHVASLKAKSADMEKRWGADVWPSQPKTVRAIADEIARRVESPATQASGGR